MQRWEDGEFKPACATYGVPGQSGIRDPDSREKKNLQRRLLKN
jgi:hypothetical protein